MAKLPGGFPAIETRPSWALRQPHAGVLLPFIYTPAGYIDRKCGVLEPQLHAQKNRPMKRNTELKRKSTISFVGFFFGANL